MRNGVTVMGCTAALALASLCLPCEADRSNGCHGIALTARHDGKGTFRVYVRNVLAEPVSVDISHYDFTWSVDERTGERWEQAVAGAYVRGVSEGTQGATPTRRVSVRPKQFAQVAVFDANAQDIRAQIGINARSRIQFAQAVVMRVSGGRGERCTVTSAPLEFRLPPAAER